MITHTQTTRLDTLNFNGLSYELTEDALAITGSFILAGQQYELPEPVSFPLESATHVYIQNDGTFSPEHTDDSAALLCWLDAGELHNIAHV